APSDTDSCMELTRGNRVFHPLQTVHPAPRAEAVEVQGGDRLAWGSMPLANYSFFQMQSSDR
ncbi:hypothetical protein KUCAC02_009477, partial [Chaenocephalus aceratus]